MIDLDTPVKKIYRILCLSARPVALILSIGIFIYYGQELNFHFISTAKELIKEYQETNDITETGIYNLVFLTCTLLSILCIVISVLYNIGLFRVIKNHPKKFDEINIVKQGDADITYGIINGNNTIVFIKAGMNGTCYGYENKYLRIARELNKKHGCTVITASNPNGYLDDFDSEMKSLQAYACYHKFNDYQVYYMGHSNGASLGMMHACNHPEIKKLVCINGPLMNATDSLISGIKSFSGEKMYLIYGSKDPSFGMLKTFEALESDNVKFVKIQGASHNFGNHLDLFIALPGFFFFEDEIKCKDEKLLQQKSGNFINDQMIN